MSIDKVKEVLQKEKNRQIVLAGSHMQALTDGLHAVINRFAEDLNADAAKEGVQKCLAAAGEAATPALAQAEYELAEMVAEYEAAINGLQTILSDTVANAAALNEELTRSFETCNALQQEADAAKAQVEALTNEAATFQSAANATAATLRAEVEQLKLQAQTYKAQYEAAIADASTPVNLDNPAQPQYNPPAPQQEQAPSPEPKNIYEEAAEILKRWKGSK